MTSPLAESAKFPTPWHQITPHFEVRQHGEDAYELRSPAASLMIDKEGFDLFRSISDDNIESQQAWNSYLRVKNESRPVARTDNVN